jgi:LmbE family N-acetylglucosaminyl deacetylase
MSRLIILSPHLDDAALSCGGLASALSKTGVVEIWTVFSGAPMYGPYSPLAMWLHGISGGVTGSRLSRLRRDEDEQACKVLGASCRHLGLWDGPYRKRGDGTFLYDDLRTTAADSQDEALIIRIASGLRKRLHRSDLVVAPLSVGSHIDHVLVRRAADLLPAEQVLYYLDLPYVKRYPGEAARLIRGMVGFDYALDTLHQVAWIKAIECYTSQLRMLDEECEGPVTEFVKSAYAGGLCRLYSSSISTMTAAVEKIQMATAPRSALAPVAIFAFNRLDLLRKTIDALEAADGFANTPLYVFVDAPRAHRTDEATEVSSVRDWLDEWSVRTGAKIFKSDVHQGLRKSIISGIASVLADHETVIVLEDDIIVSRSFLSFMNQGLEANKNRWDIFQISGYFVPHQASLPPLGLLRVPGSWGWATWRRAWAAYRDDAENLLKEVNDRDGHAFDLDDTYAFREALEKNVTGELDTWSVRWYASIFLRGGLVVYPRLSLTRNIGYGDRATNTLMEPMAKTFTRQTIAVEVRNSDWGDLDSLESDAYLNALEDFYRWQHSEWVKPSLTDRVRARWRLVTGQATRV